jgi:D-arginine dehydrogenase
MNSSRAETTVIIGAGIAGAATAYFLARGGRKVVLVEKEAVPGAHSTGRNAAILRTFVGDPVLYRLAGESLAFYSTPPEGFTRRPLLNPVGLFLAAPDGGHEALAHWEGEGRLDPWTRHVDPEVLYRRVPMLMRGLTSVVYRPTEGVLDVHSILEAFLKGAHDAGAVSILGEGSWTLECSNGRVAGVRTGDRSLAANEVVIAGGGWAAAIAASAGLPMPLVPSRRHLLVTGPVPDVPPDWPVVWIAGDEFYFRPESGGLLLCACDTVPVEPEHGEVVDPAAVELIAAKVARWLPVVSNAPAAHVWSGMRTFAPDHRFVIGPDPRVEGLFWVAGLGGHGMTCAPAIGSLAADWILRGESEHPSAGPLLPSRTLSGHSGTDQ